MLMCVWDRSVFFVVSNIPVCHWPREDSSEESSRNMSSIYSDISQRLKGSLGSPYVHVSCPIQQVDGVFP